MDGARDVAGLPDAAERDVLVVGVRNCSSSAKAVVMAERVTPGETAFTRTPCGPHSAARDRVSASRAPLLAEYSAVGAVQRCATTEEIPMMLPPPSRAIRSAAAPASSLIRGPRAALRPRLEETVHAGPNVVRLVLPSGTPASRPLHRPLPRTTKAPR